MCEYCELKEPLDSLASKWLFDYTVDIYDNEAAFGAVIVPESKQLDISVVSSPVADRELLTERIPIKFCPMCGRKIEGGAEERPLTRSIALENLFSMYDGNCAISVVRENGEQLCAVQDLDGIQKDEWYEECRLSLVTSIKIVPDEYEESGVVLLVTVK